jgi:hypothetical protein
MNAHKREIFGLPYKDLLSYWQHYWRHCIDKLTDKDNVSFKVVGPRMLLKDLIEELEGHGLSNQDNISLFRKEISRLDKNDGVFYQLCHPAVTCLLKRLGNTANRDSCEILCRKILDTLVVKRYLALLVDWLAKTIDETTTSNFASRKKINDITHLVIAEYIAEGFVFDEIKNFSNEIPGVYIAEGGVVLAAPSEFDGLKQSDFDDEENYNKAIYKRIENWDVYRRLDVLKEYYFATPSEAFFIVRLEGLKGQIDDFIGDINIYSPKVKQYIKDNGKYSLSYVEEVLEDRDRVNAAIPIDYISLEQARVYAKTKLEEVLDILMLTYRTNTPVTMSESKYAVVVDGNEVAGSAAEKDGDTKKATREEMIKYIEAFDLSNVSGDGFKFLSDKHRVFEVGHGALKIRLKNAAHWYTKAAASDKDEDVLLYSWFAIEGLLKVDSRTSVEVLNKDKKENSLKMIQEFVTSIFCKRYFYSYLKDTYRNYYYLLTQYDNYYDLTDEVISKAGLCIKVGDRYRDGDFLNAVPDMVACINDDIVRDELTLMGEFYTNDKGLRDKEQQIKEDLLMIYRLRNMIVHNAALSCVNMAFYAREAKFYALQVIRYVMDNASGDKSIEEIVLGAKLDYQVFMANFNEELSNLRSGN